MIQRRYYEPICILEQYPRIISEIIIDIIRLLARYSLLDTTDIEFPLYTEITFIIPDNDNNDYLAYLMDKNSAIDSWPAGFCDVSGKNSSQTIGMYIITKTI